MAAAMFALIMLQEENEVIEEERPPRLMRERTSAFHLEEKKFKKLYRLPKELAHELIAQLTPYLRAPSRSSALSVETKVLAALRFFAGGPYQSYIGEEEYTAMDQSSVSRCITEVAKAICEHLMQHWIKLDLSPESVAGLREGFYQKYGFPGAIGAIDCTHVAIVAPPVDNPIYMERQYYNHKRYHSINVQLVCDSKMRILNVNARFPGATNDAYIYANSGLRRGLIQMKERYNVNAWLIGDSGYPLEPRLMTPIAGDILPNSPEERFNRSLCRARSIVEQCNGVLKARWRCLLKHRVLHYMPEKASDIINSCCVLHNMCIERNVAEEEIPVNVEENGMYADPNPEAQNHRAGLHVRQRIIRDYFQ